MNIVQSKNPFTNAVAQHTNWLKTQLNEGNTFQKVKAVALIVFESVALLFSIVGIPLFIFGIVKFIQEQKNEIAFELPIIPVIPGVSFQIAPGFDLFQGRRVPISSNMMMREDGLWAPMGGVGILFKDEDIVEKIEIVSEIQLGNEVEAKITSYGKAVIPQIGWRACSAASAAMLIYDLGGQINLNSIHDRSLSNWEDIERDIKSARLQPLFSTCASLEELETSIQEKGSAIVTIHGALGGHFIVVDAITDRGVTVRDPYHGWALTVTKEAFLEEWFLPNGKMELMQAKKE